MKILLVEDDPRLISIIQRDLSAEGYQISVALDGTTGLGMALKSEFNLIILDVMLPGINGIEVCRKIREAGNETPVLMLTALGTTENIVTGLDNGADDYMVKPFSLDELNARIRTLTRRRNTAPVATNVLQAGDLIINTDERSVKRADKTIDLTATEYRLIEFLVKNKNRMLSRIEILEHVWDIDFNMGTNVVDVYINYLRKKLDKDYEVKLIHTAIGMGYVLKEPII